MQWVQGHAKCWNELKEICICDKDLILHHLLDVYKDSNCIDYLSNWY